MTMTESSTATPQWWDDTFVASFNSSIISTITSTIATTTTSSPMFQLLSIDHVVNQTTIGCSNTNKNNTNNSSLLYHHEDRFQSGAHSEHNFNDDIEDIGRGLSMVAFVASILISVIGLCGNSATIAALVRFGGRWSLHSAATTRFVVHLAVVDLLFCAAVLPLNSGRYLTRSWPFGTVLCRAYPLIYYGSVATSLLLITVITVNRLILIAFNTHYRRLYSPAKVRLQVAFCWAFSYGIMSLPTFDLWGHTGLNPSTFSCTILPDSRGKSPKKFLFSLAFLLPMSVIVLCYSAIFIHVRRQSALRAKVAAKGGGGGGRGGTTAKRDLRLTLLICVVFGTFLLCFLPLFIDNVFIPDSRYPVFHVCATCCAWLNACINPFIYFGLNPRYRAAFTRLFRGSSNTSYAVSGMRQTLNTRYRKEGNGTKANHDSRADISVTLSSDQHSKQAQPMTTLTSTTGSTNTLQGSTSQVRSVRWSSARVSDS